MSAALLYPVCAGVASSMLKTGRGLLAGVVRAGVFFRVRGRLLLASRGGLFPVVFSDRSLLSLVFANRRLLAFFFDGCLFGFLGYQVGELLKQAFGEGGGFFVLGTRAHDGFLARR